MVSIVFVFGITTLTNKSSEATPTKKSAQQYDAPKEILDFHIQKEQPQEEKVSFATEKPKQNVKEQLQLTFPKKITEEDTERKSPNGIIIVVVLLCIVCIAAGFIYVQWRTVKKSEN